MPAWWCHAEVKQVVQWYLRKHIKLLPLFPDHTSVQYKTPIRHFTTAATTEQVPTTNLLTPENEVDYSTVGPSYEVSKEAVTTPEVYSRPSKPEEDEETTLATTTFPVTTTTTEVPTTTKSHRIRGRPNKYEITRPRFSVKEYRSVENYVFYYFI